MPKKKSIRSEYLYQYILQNIEKGEYSHHPFPSERQLARDTGTSITTVKSAIKKLIKKGYLQRPGKRCRPFLAEHVMEEWGKKKHVIVIISTFPSEASFLWISGIRKACDRRDFECEISYYNDEKDRNLAGKLHEKYDLIFLVPPTNPSPGLLSKMRSCSDNLVTLWHDFTKEGLGMVDNTPIAGMNILMQHLCKMKYKTVNCVNSEPENEPMMLRIRAWEKFLKENGMHGDLWSGSEPDIGASSRIPMEMIRRHLEAKKPLPDAFICTTEGAAVGIARGLYDFGLVPGKDVGLCAFCPSGNLIYHTPSITSLQSPDISEVVEEVIHQHIDLKSPKAVRFEPSTIKIYHGESTAKKNHSHSVKVSGIRR